MGFYYFIILFVGIFFILGAGLQAFKHHSLSKKRGILGVIGLSIFLFTPGSSDIIAEFLRLNE
ncbi:hypothetical protein [Oceanobacillus saliphilus]|uniref:hypothetical protein n=1 Tax=Oceanobacillus saliphilus TaxID=2925834 RepID=UPI00201D8870|nr:hypothetical protein [Oceanobacillus saliphilus]